MRIEGGGVRDEGGEVRDGEGGVRQEGRRAESELGADLHLDP